MTPNLARLFQIANRGTGFSLETQLTSEKMLRKLFMCHGEALIEALELARRALRVGDVDALPIIEQLLAQLEAEAQP